MTSAQGKGHHLEIKDKRKEKQREAVWGISSFSERNYSAIFLFEEVSFAECLDG